MAAAKKAEVVTTDDFKVEDEPKSADKYVTVKAPFTGAKTLVPEALVESLLDSGYKK